MENEKTKSQKSYEKLKENYTVIKIQSSDDKRLEKLKLHRTEPKWSVIERLLEENKNGWKNVQHKK